MGEPKNPWISDRLDRQDDAKFLYNFLMGQLEKRRSQGQTASYVLNVDADWGGGKSFFLDGLAFDLETRGHLVARINAWRDDHAQDPYVAIMAAIDAAFSPFIKRPGKISRAWRETKSSGGAIAVRVGGTVLKGLVKKHVGVSLDEITSSLTAEEGTAGDLLDTAIATGASSAGEQLEKLFDSSLEALIEGFNRTDRAMSDFRTKLANSLAEISSKRDMPLFILVDELDRCRPTYAVHLLERVKHLFDVEGVVFVFATNADQLRHSIAGSYGANFDGFRYLKRFFDRTYVFGKPTTSSLIQSLCETLPKQKLRAPDDDIVLALASGCDAYEFDLRAIVQVIEMIDSAATAWPHSVAADIVLLFPLCAEFYRTGKAAWPHAESEALKKWKVTRYQEDRYRQHVIDRSILYYRAYSTAVSVFRDLQKASELQRSSTVDVGFDHVYNTFSQEWSGKPVNPKAASVQTDLLAIVAHAGRMSDSAGTVDAS